jgi:hypothetical protein
VDQAGFKSIAVAEQKSIIVDVLGNNLTQCLLGASDSYVRRKGGKTIRRNGLGSSPPKMPSYSPPMPPFGNRPHDLSILLPFSFIYGWQLTPLASVLRRNRFFSRLAAACAASPPLRDLVGTVTKILFCYDYANTIANPIGAPHLNITLDGTTLTVCTGDSWNPLFASSSVLTACCFFFPFFLFSLPNVVQIQPQRRSTS